MLETPRDRPLPAGWAQRAGQSEVGMSREKQEAARVRRGQGTTEEGAEGGYTCSGAPGPRTDLSPHHLAEEEDRGSDG